MHATPISNTHSGVRHSSATTNPAPLSSAQLGLNPDTDPTATTSSATPYPILHLRHQARCELRAAIQQLSARGLYYSTKWCAELLYQIGEVDENITATNAAHPSSSRPSSASASQSARSASSSLPPTTTHSHQKPNQSTVRTRVARGGPILAPPSFGGDEMMMGGATPAMRSGRRDDATADHLNMTATSRIGTQLFAASPFVPSSTVSNRTTGRTSVGVSAFPPLGAAMTPAPAATPAQPNAADTSMMSDVDRSPIAIRIQGADEHQQQQSQHPSPQQQLPHIHLPPSLRSTPPHLLSDAYHYSRSLFDLKEFHRAAHVLRDVSFDLPESNDPHEYINSNQHICLFMRCYSLYMAGEKRKEEEMIEKRAPSATENGAANNAHVSTDDSTRGPIVNREIRGLQSLLSTVLRSPSSPYANDAFLWYLYGLVLRDLGLKSAAQKSLQRSVELFPWNWSAWQALGMFMKNRDEVNVVIGEMTEGMMTRFETWKNELMNNTTTTATPPPPFSSYQQPPGVYMKDFFLSDLLIQLQSNSEDESLTILSDLTEIFPHSLAVRCASAMAYYNKRLFDEAQHLFELIRKEDPFHWEYMDTYSNILYVKDDRISLSLLAHSAFQQEKYRLQTCCIIGNYYSSQGERERAILYFKRALSLNSSYLSAWTLMGHEYVELRNTPAAIECYRSAIDINPRDYRAWYGLGQTYEILQMNQYSIYYFKKACEIKPYDPRMWCAIGENYEKLSLDGSNPARIEDAIHCYLRAESHDDSEGVALNKLAVLYKRRGSYAEAAQYYKKVLKRHQVMDEEMERIEEEEQQQQQMQQQQHDTSMMESDEKKDQFLLNHQQHNPSSSSTFTSAAPAPLVALHTDAVDAILFLAEYYCKHVKDYEKAERYCNRLIDIGGTSKDTAKSLLIEIRQHKAQLAHAHRTASSSKRTPLAPTTRTAMPPASAVQQTPQQTPMRTPAGAAPTNTSMASSPGFFDSPS